MMSNIVIGLDFIGIGRHSFLFAASHLQIRGLPFKFAKKTQFTMKDDSLLIVESLLAVLR